ncbi:uncharacterized protein K452DRAFT_18131 [Aplosporella prunicola CBS 121167]|uniref:Uncharacterized protein n=1 Tax=Aplosporella prunicola CBS 121167 TaxID=1176127 RepID=A0A6A6BE04_9PEZI|nr:uncharacterized protein K452DRAFT_18131 [Aplosporella prunicola CBS 121167]KAF2142409.1 hypothetical protein K452DRAFT_18131 [Aplosporella prunicola CBS 121167]
MAMALALGLGLGVLSMTRTSASRLVRLVRTVRGRWHCLVGGVLIDADADAEVAWTAELMTMHEVPTVWIGGWDAVFMDWPGSSMG